MFQPPFVNIIDPTSTRLRAVDNGFVFLGKEDTDPTIPANQIPVYYTDENGATQQLSQPIQLNGSGVPVLSKSSGTIINPIFYADVVSIVVQYKSGKTCYSDKNYPALNDYFTHLFSAAGYSYQGQWAPNIQIPAKADRIDGFALWESAVGKIIIPIEDNSFTTGTTFSDDFANNKFKYILTSGEFVNIKNFGAVGDGVTDDTLAIQKAINSSNAIYIPEGIYKVTSKLNVVGGMTIVGAGRWASIIETYVDDFAIEKIDTVARESMDLFDFQMRDKLKGPNSAGIKMYSPSSNHFEGLRMQFYTKQAFLMQRSIMGIISDVNCGTCGTGFEFEDDGSFTVKAILKDFQAASCGTGVKFTGTVASANMTNGIIENCDIAVHADTSVSGKSSSVWIEGCKEGYKLLNSQKFTFENPALPNVDHPYVMTFNSSIPYFQRGFTQDGAQYKSSGFAYRENSATMGTSNSWLNLNLGTIEHAFYVNFNPGGGSPQKIKIEVSGVYDIDFFANFRNNSSSDAKVAVRLTKNGVEIPSSYATLSLNGDTANKANGVVSRSLSIELDKNDEIILQAATTNTSVLLDANTYSGSLPAPAKNIPYGVRIKNQGLIINSTPT